MNVELIYDNDCPNVKAIREQLLKAFAKVKLPATWKEWERSDSNAPDYVKDYGSPTLLVNGQDIVGEAPSGTSCRLYYDAATGHYEQIPSIDKIAMSLQKAKKSFWPH